MIADDPARRIDADDGRNRREREFFANWAPHPEGDALRWRRELELLRRARPGGLGAVLSLGCGRGTFETRLARHADSVLGVDVSPESIAYAKDLASREGLRNVAFRCADVLRLELSETFDTVVCIGFLHHLSDAEDLALLKRIRSHLNEGGLLHTQDPSCRGVLRTIGRVVLGARYDDYHSQDERELDPERVCELFRLAGFRGVELRFMDVSLIPGMQIFPRAPGWLMRGFALADRLFCATPLARWASGFAIHAIR